MTKQNVEGILDTCYFEKCSWPLWFEGAFWCKCLGESRGCCLWYLKNIVFMVSSGVFGAFTQKNEWLSIWGISIFGHCGLKVSLVHWHSRMMSSFQGISILWPLWFTVSLVEWFKRDDELISYDFTLLCHCLGSCPAPFCMISPLGCVDMRRLITCILMKIHCCIHCVFVFCEVKSK